MRGYSTDQDGGCMMDSVAAVALLSESESILRFDLREERICFFAGATCVFVNSQRHDVYLGTY